MTRTQRSYQPWIVEIEWTSLSEPVHWRGLSRALAWSCLMRCLISIGRIDVQCLVVLHLGEICIVVSILKWIESDGVLHKGSG